MEATRERDYQPGQPIPGTVYSVVRLIGVGGMGTVYDVEDTTIGKRYVLKTLHPKLGAREDLARRIQNEARTLARLNHPNIVEVITAGVTSDDLRLPYYVMERLNGQSLRLVLEKKGRLELSHAYHIGIDLLDALDHAHDKGVIHRDVKPDNIFLHRTSAGVTVTKLLDFGIVSVFDSGKRDTAGRFVGTLRYAAPEQLRGETPTAKMDIYAAALVIYEMVAGRGPFDDEGDAHRVAGAHMNKYAPPLSRFVAAPKELEALLMAALAKDPEGRPRDAFSFAASLRNFKRALRGSQVESTDLRATAPAVIAAPESVTRSAKIGGHSPEGDHGTSSVDVRVSSAPAVPKTTLPGITPSTTRGTLATAAPDATSPTTADSVDRLASTGSLAPDGASGVDVSFDASSAADSPPTESLPPSEPAPAAIAPIRWPPERPPAPSVEPQVRSLPAAPPGRASRSAIVAGTVVVSVIATLAMLLAARGGPPTATLTPAEGMDRGPKPVVALAAPTLSPPWLDDAVERDAAAPSVAPEEMRLAPLPRGLPVVSPPVVPPGSHPKKAGSRAPAFAADRPGPGF